MANSNPDYNMMSHIFCGVVSYRDPGRTIVAPSPLTTHARASVHGCVSPLTAPRVRVGFGRVTAYALVDSGATISCMCRELFESIVGDPDSCEAVLEPLTPTTTSMQDAGGQALEVVGRVRLRVTVAPPDVTFAAQFLVVDQLGADLLWGEDMLIGLDCVIDFARRTLESRRLKLLMPMDIRRRRSQQRKRRQAAKKRALRGAARQHEGGPFGPSVRIGEASHPGPSSRPVQMLDEHTGDVLGDFGSVRAAAQARNLKSTNSIVKALNEPHRADGNRRKAGGYAWRYRPDADVEELRAGHDTSRKRAIHETQSQASSEFAEPSDGRGDGRDRKVVAHVDYDEPPELEDIASAGAVSRKRAHDLSSASLKPDHPTLQQPRLEHVADQVDGARLDHGRTVLQSDFIEAELMSRPIEVLAPIIQNVLVSHPIEEVWPIMKAVLSAHHRTAYVMLTPQSDRRAKMTAEGQAAEHRQSVAR